MSDCNYKCESHDVRIEHLEKSVSAIVENQNKMITEQALTNVKLETISKQLENGIKSKLVTLDNNMAKILPIIENRVELDKVIRNAIVILACGGAASLFIFVLRQYLN